MAWDAISRDRATFGAWLNEHVLNVVPASERETMDYTSDEMMTVTAARALRDGMTCFVGIGLPSEAANLARARTRRTSC